MDEGGRGGAEQSRTPVRSLSSAACESQLSSAGCNKNRAAELPPPASLHPRSSARIPPLRGFFFPAKHSHTHIHIPRIHALLLSCRKAPCTPFQKLIYNSKHVLSSVQFGAFGVCAGSISLEKKWEGSCWSRAPIDWRHAPNTNASSSSSRKLG